MGRIETRFGSDTARNVPRTVYQCGTCVGIPASGSVGSNGALTLTTAHEIVYPIVWLYFPTGAVYAGSVAGFYFVVMSSTSVGVIYNNIYIPGTNLPMNIPSAPTPIVAAGPGGYTQSTAEITLHSWVIPGGLLGKNGIHSFNLNSHHYNSAGSKILRSYLVNDDLGGGATLTTTAQGYYMGAFANAGSLAKQIAMYNTSPGTTATSPSNTRTTANVDTSVSASFKITCSLAVATDYMIITLCAGIVIPN